MQGKQHTPDEIAALHQRIAELEAALADREESESYLRAILNTTLHGLIVLAPNRQVVMSNTQARQLIRALWGRDLAAGQSVEAYYGLVDPAAVENFEHCFDTALSGTPLTVSGSLPTQQGQVLSLQVNFQPVWAEDGTVAGVCLGLLDITAYKQAEEETRQLAQFREAVIENANVLVSALDRDRKFVLWNRGAERITGYTREEVLGHNKVWEWAYPDAEYRRQVARASAAVAQGQSVEDLQFTLRTRGGESKTVAFYSRQLVDLLGEPVGVVNIGIDVTTRQQVERALRASERKLRSLLEQSRDGVVLSDEKGRVIEWSPGHERITGIKWHEALGRFVWDVLFGIEPEFPHTPDLREHFKALTLAALRTGQGDWLNQIMEVPIQRPDGTRCIIQSLVFPIPTDKGFMLGAIHRDITEQKRTEERALELAVEQERLTVFKRLLEDVTHDLKTPLTTIQLSLHLLEHLPDPDKRQRQFEVMKAQIEYLSRLLRDLRTIAQQDADTPLQVRSLDLNDFAQSIVLEHEPLAAQKAQTLYFSANTPLPAVQADREKLTRAVINILTNAINYTPEGGTIAVCTGIHEGAAALEISDTGPGIHPDDLPFIFNPFFRSDRARSTYQGGMGLGLAIAHQIITAHGGQIEVESTPAQGTRFRILLPRT
jgi:PAS domain S-box-containing protein